MLDQAILEFIEDRRKEQITVTEKKSAGKLHYYLKNFIPMFNMNLEPQEAGLEGCAAIFSSSPSYECESESLKKCSRND